MKTATTKLDEAKARWGKAESIKGEGRNPSRPWHGTPPPHAPAMVAAQEERKAA